MKMQKSEVQEAILKTGVGYRNNELFGGEDHLMEDVIDFEVNELGNDDILDYCMKCYGVGGDQKEIFNFVHEVLHAKTVYGYWMTTREGVEKLYFEYEQPLENYLTSFDLSNIHYIVISDLGLDGICLVSDTPLSKVPILTLPIVMTD